MLSVYDQGGFDACPAPFNMAEHVLSAGRQTPDKIALSVLRPTGAQRWSYDRLTAAVLGTATGLIKAGFRPGDLMLMRVGNTLDFPILYLGAIAAGIVPAPSSSQLTARETEGLISQLKPKAILRDPDVASPETDLPEIGPETYRSWHQLPPAEFERGDPNRLAYVVFTSGTSGRPRAVAHAHRAIWARQMMMQDWYGLGPEDRLLHAGAFNWTFTLGTGLMDPWTMGATALIPAPGTRPDQLPLLLKRNDATLFAAAPGVFRQILKAPIQPMTKLRHGLSAGEKLPASLRSRWESATGTTLHEAFGMSECSTFVSASPTRPSDPDGLGFPQNGRRIAILDETGVPTQRGEPGALAVHRDDPGLMLGYLNDEPATQERMSGDWFLSGDQALMTQEGQIKFVGRADDMMNAGGFRVFPLEVEAAMANVAGLSEIAVTDVEIKPDVTVIVGFYTGPEPLSDGFLSEQAQARLARYKQPRIWQYCTALPRTATGKLRRGALKDLLELG